MRDKKRGVRYIVGLSIGEKQYRVNKVAYLVESKFYSRKSGILLRSRMERLLETESAHLTISAACDTIRTESAIGSAGKEDYADQSETTSQSGHHGALLPPLP